MNRAEIVTEPLSVVNISTVAILGVGPENFH